MRLLFSLLICLACFGLSEPASARDAEGKAPTLMVSSDRVEMTAADQRLVFTKGSQGYSLITYVKDGNLWREGFASGRPLLSGPLFGDLPSAVKVLSNTATNKSVEFTGRHGKPEYDWTMRVSAATGNPLFHFTINSRLREPLQLDVPQPVVAFWNKIGDDAVFVDQGPDSIYGTAGIPHGYGFPAAYLWDNRFEAAIFFNFTPMRWMQRDGVARSHDVRIMTRREGDQAGLGMHFKRLSGRHLPAGDMIIDFHLYQGIRASRPSMLTGLDVMIRAFAPLHPAMAPCPQDQTTGQPGSWDHVATQTIADLRTPNTMAEFVAPWHDAPVELVPPQEKMVVHPATAQSGQEQVAAGWDFSTVNNHLTPWLLLTRLRGDRNSLQIALQKKDALPRFYDPKAGLIRHGTRVPEHVGDREMSWQNLFFHKETLRAASATAPHDFNPAVAGRFLMATRGLRELAHNVDYVLPQWFDPYRKQPIVQNDVPQLGIISEPWQVGTYASLMLEGYDFTRDAMFLHEARQAVDTLMERMQYRVKNEIYDRTYKEAGEFPITELFGNADGIAAAYQLYKQTGQAKYLRYSRDFLNTLLRLTPWYEDETDPVSRALQSAGLFFPHCGAHVVTPWETIEAHLMLVWALKHDPDNPLRPLLLKLVNLNRTNSFYFYPAFWTEAVRAHDGASRSGIGRYFPIEPFYSLEGEGGHRGTTAAYMASLGLWNDWLFEALARVSDPQTMLLNLDAMDGYESALTGVERHFLVYNPTAGKRVSTVRFLHLSDGRYQVTIGKDIRDLSAEQLRKGIPIPLAGGAEVRLTVRRNDFKQQQLRLKMQRDSQNALCHAYQVLEEHGSASPEVVQTFKTALCEFHAGRYEKARDLAIRLLPAKQIK